MGVECTLAVGNLTISISGTKSRNIFKSTFSEVGSGGLFMHEVKVYEDAKNPQLRFQGYGLSRHIMGIVLNSATQTYTHVMAGSDKVGAYAWIKFGFLPEKEWWNGKKGEALREKYISALEADNMLRIANGDVPRQSKEDLKNTIALLRKSKNPEHIRIIADDKVLGFEVLYNIRMPITLDLKDTPSMEMLCAYCEMKPYEMAQIQEIIAKKYISNTKQGRG